MSPPRKVTRSIPTKAPSTLNTDEQNKLLNELLYSPGFHQPDHVRYRNYGLGVLMLDAGLRIGEVTRLLITDLLLGGEPVKGVFLEAHRTKNKTERTVPLSARAQNAIKMMHDNVWRPFEDRPGAYAFFAYMPHEPLSARQVQRIIGRAAIRSIGRPIHPHVLRHTFGSKMMRVTNERVVQQLLGHKSITSTQIYTHPNSDDREKAIKAAETSEPNKT